MTMAITAAALSIAVQGVRRKVETSRRSCGSWATVVSVRTTTQAHAAPNSAAHSSSSLDRVRVSSQGKSWVRVGVSRQGEG